MSYQLEVGKKIFENIPEDKLPLWCSLLLNEFKNSPIAEPKEIADLREFIKGNEWEKCDSQFSKIRNLSLVNKKKQNEIYLTLAENISKILYNQTETNALFDLDAGFSIFDLAIKLAKTTNSVNKIKRVEGILNLFESDKNEENFFALKVKSSGEKLLKNILESNEPEFKDLRTELDKNHELDEISLSNPISRLHKNKENIPDGSFEFQFDLMLNKSKIGYYSLLWSNEIEILDEYFVIKTAHNKS